METGSLEQKLGGEERCRDAISTPLSIDDKIVKNMDKEIEKLLIKLLKIPSVSGDEKKIGEFIFKEISSVDGFAVKKQFVEGERFNVIAKKGKSNIWILAHMDTVSGIMPVKIDSERIYGRGACDNKGNIAGALITARRLDNINLIFTIGEETDFSGAKKAKKIVKNKDRVIVLEPVNFDLYTSQRGVVEFCIETKGEQKHSSLIKKMEETPFVRLIKIVSSLEGGKWTAFNIGKIEGGIAPNVVSGSVRAIISIRPENGAELEKITKTIENIGNMPGTKIKILNIIYPFDSQIDIPGNKIGCFTEMGFFSNSLVFGAGDLKLAHSERESIKRFDLRELPDKLVELVNKLTYLKS